MDPDFANVMSSLNMGKTQDPYVLKDGFLLYGSRLCVTKDLRAKVKLMPPLRLWGIGAFKPRPMLLRHTFTGHL